MKPNASKSIERTSLSLYNLEPLPKTTKNSLLTNTSQRKIIKNHNKSKSEYESLLQSPQTKHLKPIQTMKNLQMKPSLSSRPSPNKSTSPKKLLFLSPSNDLSIKIHNPSSDSFIKKSIKRRTQSMELEIPETLPIPPCNYISRCLFKTRIGSINGKNKKQNQDSFIIQNNLLKVNGNYLFSVCDGHGLQGHLVSRYVKLKLVQYLENYMIEYNNDPNIIEKSYINTIKLIEDQLENEGIDSMFSGTTVVSVIVLSNIIICANIGDSRAVLGKKINNNWDYDDLSKDHKPELTLERERIENSGGRIMPYFSVTGLPVGPQRVWLKDVNIPGLAMSRSLGDNIAGSVGVCSDPEFSSHALKKEDKFMIIASDGLWEFITSKEAVEIVGKLSDEGNSHLACDKLVSEAVKRWSRNDGTVDDITILVVFINQ
ncbi:hypothetical protein SteCoe_36151 [Stentor coeruleus]|uniref:PPM-type phosphatase domain-containing protein n=1 Tax=Stentor coeruleus TaxID=5963 RepID=A0A1R2AQW0_9CILI|nr:hypothetical protein SteCoe_36151 [Stentor coeruleus]